MDNIFAIVYSDKWKAIHSIKAISEKERMKLAAALLDYGCLGKEPKGLSNIAQGMFDAIKSSLFAKGRGGQIGNNNASKNKNESETNNKTNNVNECKNDCEKTNKNELYKLQTTDYKLQTTNQKKAKEKSAAAAPVVRFIKPTLDQVKDHIREKGYHFDAESFYAFYESKGWKVGNQSMKSWEMACITWEKRMPHTEQEPEVKKKPVPEVSQCPDCGSYDLIHTIDRVICKGCGAFFDYNHTKGKWERA